ncbi:twin-arginine translocase TatA/TatE family subunit [Myroides marinus]|jgi:sec-independent protein translocase protein TatA|uniref:Sec-independent protein translocase subunit TatA/TatB n=1 Tax=Myroides marinus TaxID=703342 RepID=UPI00074216BD|nr:twin-arginine translocase TatA/TatE family subunit [Myroides marinus]MDR0196052.1 twin-arginine translocase TatA/TatE family subunit [Myroides sp.]KUF43259.1 preprotein translocase subunit TatA [Myroides marinus]MDM1346684.1 twin-arginine translocase TatA/TatE family subunit [Myroides marinus]MDM1350128.1 twin-arginine translocase TatA/TatE family subunit [Myroides marinus]MDM1355096.1 twin-arginine translocase TatA/TatE family subunit [Myroides marinus]
MISTIIPLGGVAPSELIVVVAIALLLFGGKKIPELMKGLGTGIREFKQATRETNTNSAMAKEAVTESKSTIDTENESVK